MKNRREVPLYNCYWCKCAYCKNRSKIECFNKCIRCHQQNNFKMDDYCDNFVEDIRKDYNKSYSNYKCTNCAVKRKLLEIRRVVRVLKE